MSNNEGTLADVLAALTRMEMKITELDAKASANNVNISSLKEHVGLGPDENDLANARETTTQVEGGMEELKAATSGTGSNMGSPALSWTLRPLVPIREETPRKLPLRGP